jgi:hypothetical protein
MCEERVLRGARVWVYWSRRNENDTTGTETKCYLFRTRILVLAFEYGYPSEYSFRSLTEGLSNI